MSQHGIHDRRGKSRASIEIVLIVLIVAIAYLFCFHVGQLGFFPLDQSILFDGGWRIVQGQVPYEDFDIPFGPVSLWLHAFFIKILGPTFFSYLFHAALINALACLLCIALIRLCLPRYPSLALVGGLVTALWFYAPSGTPYMEQTAFFFALLALYCTAVALLARNTGDLLRRSLSFASGIAVVLAVLSKQNAGLLFLPLPVLLFGVNLLSPRRTLRPGLFFLLGLAAGCVAFTAWLFLYSDPSTFFRLTVTQPFELIQSRVFRPADGVYGSRWGLLAFFLSGPTLGPLQQLMPVAARAVNFMALVMATLYFGIFFSNLERFRKQCSRLTFVNVVLGFIALYHTTFIHTASNESENGLPFVGLLLALLFGTGAELRERITVHYDPGDGQPTRLKTSWFPVLAWCLFAVLLGKLVFDGYRAGRDRVVHQATRQVRYVAVDGVQGLEPLRLPLASATRGQPVTSESLSALVDYLHTSNKNFFVFPDYTILYGLLGKPSPQPLLWFHKGLTYPRKYDAELDRRIVGSLKANNIDIVVLEVTAFFNPQERLNEFPELKLFLMNEFEPVEEIGNFVVLGRKT